MSLVFVGLGPSPRLDDLTRRAERALRRADRVLLEAFTAAGNEVRVEALARLRSAPVESTGALDRASRARLIEDARDATIALAVPGDPLIATPHAVLVAEARAAGIEVEIVPGLSAMTAAPSLVGLDAGRVSTIYIEDPRRLQPVERAAIERGLCAGEGVAVLAAGREEEHDDEAWRLLAAELGAGAGISAHRVSVDGGGITLVLRRATC